MVSGVSGQLTDRKSARRNTSSRPTSSMPSSAATALSAIGIVGDELHVEGLRQAEQLGADIADAERAERPADQADAHMVGRAWPSRPGPRGSSRSLISSLPVSASMKVMIETATGRRTPSGVITSAMPASVQAGDVDVVVADAEAGHDGEPAVRMDALRARSAASAGSARRNRRAARRVTRLAASI